jgi:hypothetical protein
MRWTSAGIGAFGALAQLVLLIMCIAGEVMYAGNSTQRLFANAIEYLWAFLPAIAFVGIVHAIRLRRQQGCAIPAVVGLLLNLLWLASGAAIWWFMYSRTQKA